MARVRLERGALRTAEQSRDRHAEALAFEIPQRDVERRERGLEHGATAPSPRVVQPLPVTLGSRGIVPDEMRRELAYRGLDGLQRAVQRALAPPAEPLVGFDAHEQPVAPVDPVLERGDGGDLHRLLKPFIG